MVTEVVGSASYKRKVNLGHKYCAINVQPSLAREDSSFTANLGWLGYAFIKGAGRLSLFHKGVCGRKKLENHQLKEPHGLVVHSDRGNHMFDVPQSNRTEASG